MVRECERQTEPRASANFHYCNFEYITGCSRHQNPDNEWPVVRLDLDY